jgi:PadR family transcriptional regulator PadR
LFGLLLIFVSCFFSSCLFVLQFFRSTPIQYVIFQTYYNLPYTIKHDIKVLTTEKHIEAYQSIPKTIQNLEKTNKQRHPTTIQDDGKPKNLTEPFRKQIVQRINRNFLDILLLRLIQRAPIWGYKIIKETEKLFGIKLGHGALYPLLNSLEAEGYATSEKITKKGRVRKVYRITQKGTELINAYRAVLKEQIKKLGLKET